jgi:hypothetical protein
MMNLHKYNANANTFLKGNPMYNKVWKNIQNDVKQRGSFDINEIAIKCGV